MLLGKVAIDALNDYEKQRKEGKNPVFYSKNIGIAEMSDAYHLGFIKVRHVQR